MGKFAKEPLLNLEWHKTPKMNISLNWIQTWALIIYNLALIITIMGLKIIASPILALVMKVSFGRIVKRSKLFEWKSEFWDTVSFYVRSDRVRTTPTLTNDPMSLIILSRLERSFWIKKTPKFEPRKACQTVLCTHMYGSMLTISPLRITRDHLDSRWLPISLGDSLTILMQLLELETEVVWVSKYCVRRHIAYTTYIRRIYTEWVCIYMYIKKYGADFYRWWVLQFMSSVYFSWWLIIMIKRRNINA